MAVVTQQSALILYERVSALEKSTGMTLPRMAALTALMQGPLRVGKVADAMTASPAMMTALIDYMVEAGLVRRCEDPASRRNVVVEALRPTPAAEALALYREVRAYERAVNTSLMGACVLEVLAGGEMSMGKLAESLPVNSPGLTTTVGTLVRRGRVTRRRNTAGDRRQVLVQAAI